MVGRLSGRLLGFIVPGKYRDILESALICLGAVMSSLIATVCLADRSVCGFGVVVPSL